MRNRKSSLTACGVLVAGVFMAGLGHARVLSNDMTYLTFSGPVALPGVTLTAGTYVFESAPENGLVRVSSTDGKRLYLTAFTRRITRPAGLPANRVVVLGETAPGVPAPIRAWFPIGRFHGHEFIYGR